MNNSSHKRPFGLPVFILIAVSLASVSQVSAVSPGVQARVTKKAVDYANTVAHNTLAKELQTLKIPDQSGKDGHVEWSFWNIRNQGCTVPASSMNIGSGGLTWSMSNLGLKLKADWRAKYKKGWVKVSTSGSVDITFSGVSLSVQAKIGRDPQGRPSISAQGCTASIGDISVHFHGGTSFILNLLKGVIEDKIKKLLTPQICNIVNKEINEDAEKRLQNLKEYVEMDHRFELDYSLISTPVWTSQFLQTDHKGEVFWKKDRTEAPFAPKSIPQTADVSKMLYLWITDYTAKTCAYVAQKNQYLVYNFTSKDLPADHADFLNTTCKVLCVGKLIPQIGQKYPKSQVEMRLNSTSVPTILFANTSVSGGFSGTADLYANTPQGKSAAYLLTLSLKVGFTVTASITNERLTGKILNHSFKVSVVKSAVGKISSKVLNIIFGGAIDFGVIPELNKRLATGVDLPLSGDVKFQNTELKLQEGSLLVATDLLYQPNSDNTLRFK